MKSVSARRLTRLPRALSQRSQTLLGEREESGFAPCVRFDPDAPRLILSPHCDDAVLSCWSVLTSNHEVEVVNVFTGSPQPGHAGVWEAVSGCADSAERARGRIAEDAAALARAGRSARNLALLDVSFRRRRPELSLAALDRALTGQLHSASRVYAPAGIGSHVDHLLTRRYAQALAHAGVPVELYAELPYCVFHGWPSWVDGRAREPDRDVNAYWRSFLHDVPEMPALDTGEVTCLQEPAITAKLEALGDYRLSLNYAVRQLLANPMLGRFEVHWRLSPGETFAPADNDGR